MNVSAFVKQAGCGLLLFLGTLPAARAQQVPAPAPADTLHKYQSPVTGAAVEKKSFFQSKGFKATVVPALLIGYGISTINGHGFYSSYDAKSDVNHLFGAGRHTHVDDFLQYAPYLELGGVLLAGVESKNDRANLALVILKGEAIMLSSVFVTKFATGIERPDASNNQSFPSGHTAQAFLAASILHTELRDKSQWYGIGAYTIASSVAVLRMVNDKHWESDVVAGAGFGILSAHLAYLTHRYRWGHRPGAAATGSTGSTFHVAPMYYGGATGLAVRWQLR